MPKASARRGSALEALLNLAMTRAFGIASRAVAGEHAPPERHRAGVAQVLEDLPIAGKAVEDQGGGIAAHADSAVLLADEKFGHAKVGGRLPGGGDARARYQSKADRIGPFRDDEGMRMIIREPVREDLIFTRAAGAQHREQAGVQIREGFQVLAVDTLDPLTIFLRVPTVANTD
jgi:hypothetical protein